MEIVLRGAAKKQGLACYFTGNPCLRGHIAKRRTDSGKCTGCEPAAARTWRSANREKARASYRKWAIQHRKEWEEKNKEQYKKSRAKWDREWCSKNREKAAEKSRRFSKKNPDVRRRWRSQNLDRVRLYEQTRRSHKKKAGGIISLEDIERIGRQQRNKCAEPSCRKNLILNARHVDHIIPLAKGGSNWPRNIQLLCRKCNLQKGATDPIVFANRKGRLL